MLPNKTGPNSPEGEEYKIIISGNIQSTNGAALGKDITGYFATNYSFNLESTGIAELNGTRSLIICISDIHMGDTRTITGGYSGFEKNKTAFMKFLNQIRLSPNVKELVIAGDMLDEWIGPMENEAFNGMTEAGFLDSVVTTNQSVVDIINNIIKDGKIKVNVYPWKSRSACYCGRHGTEFSRHIAREGCEGARVPTPR